MSKQEDKERRNFFRINDEIFLDFDVISIDEYKSAPALLESLNESSFSLSADFATLNNNIHPVLNNITQLHPDIAQYLQFLNQKIDSLSYQLLIKESSFDETRIINANLSASGIMFETEIDLEAEQLLRLELILLPEKIGILIFGKIITVKEIKNLKQVAVEFEHIRFEDQELMIKHNLNKQMTDLRDKNDNI